MLRRFNRIGSIDRISTRGAVVWCLIGDQKDFEMRTKSYKESVKIA